MGGSAGCTQQAGPNTTEAAGALAGGKRGLGQGRSRPHALVIPGRRGRVADIINDEAGLGRPAHGDGKWSALGRLQRTRPRASY